MQWVRRIIASNSRPFAFPKTIINFTTIATAWKRRLLAVLAFGAGPSMTSPAMSKMPLSSNWKALQKTLKRKEAPSYSTEAATPAKKAKKDEQPKEGKKKLNGTSVFDEKPPRKKREKKKLTTTTTTTSSDGFIPSASLAIWAEDNDISPEDLAKAYGVPPTSTTAIPSSSKPLIPTSSSSSSSVLDVLPTTSAPVGLTAKEREVGKYVAIDCEMVGVGGPHRERSALARVSMVNLYGHCVLDAYVQPKELVTDWRTWVSGVKPSDMKDAISFEEAQKVVADILKDRVLIGHAVYNDLAALLLAHPRWDLRDTSTHPEFMRKGDTGKKKRVALKTLAKDLLGIEIQGGSHSSLEDARACMLLYRTHMKEFEKENARNYPNKDKAIVKAEMKAKAKRKKEKEKEKEKEKTKEVEVPE